MAMEDAMVLARLMSEKGEPSEAFRAFQEARQARIESVRAAVIQAGRVYNFGSPVRGALIHGVAWAMTRLRPRPGSPQSKWLDTYDAVSG
jgi:2-polyprenyl-6-methoxyphenol hydroxylase-like FAD-dependent oxidoreductase